MSHATSPLTRAHYDLIRMLAEQSVREWFLEQQQAAEQPQKQEGAGEVSHPSPAPSTPTF